jgi:hypothetical protein
MNLSSARTSMSLLVALCLCCAFAPAQSTSNSGSSSKSGSSGSSGQGSGQESSNNTPFSIETEMFTYKAVEENSQVIACDIARYLFQGEVTDAAPGSRAPCTVSNGSQTTPGIIIVSSDSSLLADFQIWRADMATMSALEARANNVCVAAPEAKGENGQEGTPAPPKIRSRGLGSAAAGLAKLTPQGQAIGAALQLFSSSQTVSSVVGTVQNPALLNEVARQLRSLNILVLLPELYNPNALGAADYTNSPYLNNLADFFTAYDKCDKAKTDNGAEAASINSIIGSMDAFVKTALGAAGPGPSENNSGNTGETQPAPNKPTPTHLTEALAADDMAKQMGFTGNGASGPNPTWQHVLWLKALESGGSVNRQSNLFGTKVTFAGGAVDTYSVFRLDGELVCSGNAYNFQSPVRTKDLQKTFRAAPTDSPVKTSVLHSTCGPLPPS